MIIFFPFYNSFQTLRQPPQASNFMFVSLISNNQKKNENQNKQTRINKNPTMQKKKTMKGIQKKKKHGVYFMLAKYSSARNLP